MSMRWLRRIGRSLRWHTRDDDVVAELRLHVELEARELEAQGVPEAEARRRALVAFGGIERYREEVREALAWRWLDALRRDVAHTVRSLRRTPGVTGVIVLTLALGIGANTTFFSILNALVLRPLPVHEPDRLVVLDGEFTNPLWEQIRDRQTQWAEAAFAWSWQWDGFDLSDGGLKERIDGALVSGGFFDVLGVRAARGRTITPADDRRGAPAVAVISYRLWQTRFAGDEDIVGRDIRINRVPVTIVGVAPEGFFGLDVGRSFDVMLPIAAKPALDRDELALDRRTHWWASIGARLARGQTLEQAQAALRALQPAIREATVPEGYSPEAAAEYFSSPIELVPAATGTSTLRTQYRPALVAVSSVAALVLLIACANVANLLLARATVRRREFGLRLALGASRTRLLAQMLIEGLVLSVLGAAAGLLVARWSARLVVSQLSTWRNTVVLDLPFDGRVFAFAAAAAAVTAILAALAPAISMRARSPRDAMQQAGRGSVTDGSLGVRHSLVAVQIALSLALLVATGLVLQTYLTLSRTPTGMALKSLVTVDLDLRLSAVPDRSRMALVDRIRESVAAVPGVVSVAASGVPPMMGRSWNTAIDDPSRPPRARVSWMNAVTPGWFDTIGARILEGRDFAPGEDSRRVIVNETFARTYLESGSAVGQTVRLMGPGGTTDSVEVIGLVSDFLYQSPQMGMLPTMFVPAGETAATSLVIRLEPGHDAQLEAVLPGLVRQVDPDVTFSIHRFETLAADWLAQERLTAGLALAFGALALLLAAVGLYGVVSYAVDRRRAEIAVRLALGATRSTIIRLVVARTGVVVLAGLVAGAGLSWWGVRFLRSLLVGQVGLDLAVVGGAAAILASTALFAAWLPARRAARFDPATLLRDA